MDIFDFAMQMEKDGETYYRELASKTTHEGIKTLMILLADEEVKHYQIFEKLKSGHPEMAKSSLGGTAKNIFRKMLDKGERHFDFEGDAVSQYTKAQQLEKKSEDYYREKAAEVKDAAQTDLLNRIADEEHRHFQVIENMILLAKNPERWLENAEWRHIDEY